VTDDTTEGDPPNEYTGVAIYDENPYYWTYDGDPILLIGGSPKDNLYQHVANPHIDVEGDLDRLVEHGGNYVRHTMQSRVNDDAEASFIVQPFARVDSGNGDGIEGATYDLDGWNPEYWERFETVLEWTAERDIVMQVTFWDRFDFADHTNDTWSTYNPWNPRNNVTYTREESGLPGEWDRHPAEEVFPFMRTLEEDNDLLVEYQERYVAKVLDHALEYDHVLYNVSNETRAPKSWGDHWADFAHERAAAGNAAGYVTQMYDAWDITDEEHDRTHEDPETYDYVDVSQNNQMSGQEHYGNLTTVRGEFTERPWPVNNEKCYGCDGGPHGSTADGLERFWQSVFGGSASVRFHRPPSGLGIGETARTHVRAARDVTDELDLATTSPRPDLLGDHGENGARCLSDGTTHLILFRGDGAATLEAALPETTTVTWYDVDDTSRGPETSVGSGVERLSTPGAGYWVAIVRE